MTRGTRAELQNDADKCTYCSRAHPGGSEDIHALQTPEQQDTGVACHVTPHMAMMPDHLQALHVPHQL